MATGKGAGVTFYLLTVVLSTVLGPAQFGYHLAELNTPSEVIQCQQKSNKLLEYVKSRITTEDGLPQCIPMSPSEWGMVSSIYTLGGFIGALAAGPLSQRLGRISPMRLAFPFFLLGSLMEAVAPGIAVLGIGRFLAGVGAGACMVVGPIYISEIAPPGTKGTLGALTQIATNSGILLAQVLGYFLSYGNKWRIILGVGGGIAVLHFVGLLYGVESPEWLESKGKTTEAKKALIKIRSGSLTAEETERWGTVDSEEEGEHDRQAHGGITDQSSERTGLLEPQSHSRAKVHAESVGMLQVLRHQDHWKAIIAVISVMVAQQLCGINSVMMYSVSFLKPILPTAAGLITVAVGVLSVVATVAFAPLSDKLGRKTCLLISIAGMGTMSFLLAIGMMKNVPILTSIATLLFVASFAVGLGPVPFTLASELVPPEAVGAAQSWALASNWLATFVVAQFFPILNHTLDKGRIFFVFTALAVVFFIFISWWVPESKGKTSADEVWGRERRQE